MFCSLQCVKYAASSATRFGSVSCFLASSRRSASTYSRRMPTSSIASSLSFRLSVTSSGMLWRMERKPLSASENLPSVVSL